MLFKIMRNFFNWRYVYLYYHFFLGATAPCGPGPPHLRSLEITQNDAPKSVGLLWTSDRSVAEISTWWHTTQTDRDPCPPVGFELTISAGERPQTYALDRVVTVTGLLPLEYLIKKLPIPTKPATISLIKVKSCKVLLRVRQVNIHSYL